MLFFITSLFLPIISVKDNKYICVVPVLLPENMTFIQACCTSGYCGLVRVNECNKCKLLHIMSKAGITAAGVADHKVLNIDGTLCEYNQYDPCIDHPTHVLCIAKASDDPYKCEKNGKKECHNGDYDKYCYKPEPKPHCPNESSLLKLCKCLLNSSSGGDCSLCDYIQRFFNQHQSEEQAYNM